jgi:hypothetical protein
MEMLPTSPWSDGHITSLHYSQTIPVDVIKSDEKESIWDDGTSLLDVFDPTSLDIDFDHSCLETLDDQLLLHPMDSFVDICWAEAVYDDADRVTTPTGWSTSSSTARHDQLRVHLETPSDDDSDECRTYEDVHVPTTYIYGEGDTSGEYTSGYVSPVMKEKHTFFDQPMDDGTSSFIFLDPHFTISDPDESIHFFPTSAPMTRQRSKFQKGITTFCANLPGRLIKSAT